MKVQFMVEFKSEIVDEEKFKSLKLVETYNDPETFGMGYDIFEVEVDRIGEIKIKMGDDKVYIAEAAEKFKDGTDTKWFVRFWSPVEE